MTYAMYPRESVSLEIERDEHGRIVKAPVMWVVDFGIGRVDANELETPEWDKWAEQVYNDGILIKVLLPNSTAVTALMDHLFGPFKGACREESQKIFARRIQANADKVAKIKADMAAGKKVSEAQKKILTSAVRMDPDDVGEMVFGKLDEEGLPHPDSPFAKHFTKAKVMDGAAKLGYYPWIPEKLWTHPKVRHEIGQEDETPELQRMRELQARYEHLKGVCGEDGEGKLLVFISICEAVHRHSPNIYTLHKDSMYQSSIPLCRPQVDLSNANQPINYKPKLLPRLERRLLRVLFGSILLAMC